MIESLFLYFLCGFVLFILLILMVDHHYASKRYKGDMSDHFDGKKFYNISWNAGETFRLTQTEEEFFGKTHKNGLLSFYKWILNQKISLWKKRQIIPTIPDLKHDKKTIKVTYIGHATVLIQTHGINLLTDPVWSKRASPVQWAGPKRYTDPGVTLEDLPPIDAVLLSHNHYDHMDMTTLRYLSERDHMPIYTGLGNKRYLSDRDIENVIEMDWWDSIVLGEVNRKDEDSQKQEIRGRKNSSKGAYEGISDQEEFLSDKEVRSFSGSSKITFVPSQHFSARGISDRNRTLWGGFAWQVGETTGYFAGDTGYGPFVEDIRTRFPDGFDVGLLPIGAYNPRWFMAAMHTSPYEGMQMQRDLQIAKAVGIHYATFPLAADLQDEPLEDLAIAKLDPLFAGQDFRVGESGTSWEL